MASEAPLSHGVPSESTDSQRLCFGIGLDSQIHSCFCWVASAKAWWRKMAHGNKRNAFHGQNDVEIQNGQGFKTSGLRMPSAACPAHFELPWGSNFPGKIWLLQSSGLNSSRSIWTLLSISSYVLYALSHQTCTSMPRYSHFHRVSPRCRWESCSGCKISDFILSLNGVLTCKRWIILRLHGWSPPLHRQVSWGWRRIEVPLVVED